MKSIFLLALVIYFERLPPGKLTLLSHDSVTVSLHLVFISVQVSDHSFLFPSAARGLSQGSLHLTFP